LSLWDFTLCKATTSLVQRQADLLTNKDSGLCFLPQPAKERMNGMGQSLQVDTLRG